MQDGDARQGVATPLRKTLLLQRYVPRRETLMLRTIFLTIVAVAMSAGTASAHVEGGLAGGFASGFAHPILGADHIAAMVAVGLWGAFLGTPAIWLLPIVFPLVMALGGILGIVRVPLPGVEIGIAASALVLGAMVALAVKPHLAVAAVLVGAFAIFHGYAHGAELPDGSNAVAYSAGFVIATGLLHLCGIAIGLLTRWPAGVFAVRAAGSAIAVAGLVFLGKLI
jgi:urease accessory protein